jgi:hypothetical protein
MKIKYVTMTGADDNTSIERMAELSSRFGFAEWGILFSQAKSGVPRYPSLDWVEQLAESSFDETMRFCAHLCGKWVSDAMKLGRVTFVDRDDLLNELFHRIQLNCFKDRLRKALDPEKGELLWEGLSDSVPFILGGNYGTLEPDVRRFFLCEVYPLFDASGGHGKLAKEWPSPWVVNDTPLFCGYAGGLSPENLGEELLRIEQACQVEARKEPEIWIDAESGLRTNDEFDLDKCEQFLEIAEPWTG